MVNLGKFGSWLIMVIAPWLFWRAGLHGMSVQQRAVIEVDREERVSCHVPWGRFTWDNQLIQLFLFPSFTGSEGDFPAQVDVG